MDDIWTKVIKSTGVVGVIAFLLYVVTNHIFSEQIVLLFGGDKMFALTSIVIAALFVILLVVILKQKEKRGCEVESDGPKVTYSGKSIHNGDNNF